jgi:hypothetical protein
MSELKVGDIIDISSIAGAYYGAEPGVHLVQLERVYLTAGFNHRVMKNDIWICNALVSRPVLSLGDRTVVLPGAKLRLCPTVTLTELEAALLGVS